MVVQINTTARADEVEEVWFGDDGPYRFVTPKVAPLLSAMRKMQGLSDEDAGMQAMDSQDEWLEKGFGPDQWKRIQERLENVDDPLDTWHLVDVFEALFHQVSNRPPTSPGGSSHSSATPPSGAGPSHSASTPTSSRPVGPAI